VEALDSLLSDSFPESQHDSRPNGWETKETPMPKGDRAPKETKKTPLSIKERQAKKKAKLEAKKGMS
jgi:hypothetical protein